MSGTHGERASICLKGGQGSHFYSCYVFLILWSERLFGILLLFSRVAVLLSTRHSYLGIPSPFKRGLFRDPVLHFSTSRLEAKLPPSVTSQFLLRAGLCCRVLQWRVDNTTSEACFSKEEALFHLGHQRGRFWSLLQILALGQ